MNEQRMLLSKIKKYDFTLKELNLYLDTHPNCRRGLAMFQKYRKFRQNAAEEYSRKFGPLTPEQVTDNEHWTWTDDPWPWERR
ncbi:spore coat protein CotJB [Ruminococcus sp.]|uniref:spore coat protein CotJB n=1 Tax=Ruminococcus sp. TaxID=41978 RepID=UPI0025DD85A0|nr:spore coat protein CotJB [Ruminococcus sp.]MCR4638137.1 spore coat protein CotJB [Ruminococcus sp.]